MNMFPKRPIPELLQLCAQKSPHWNKHWKEFENRFGDKILFFILREMKKRRRGTNTPDSQEEIADLRQDVYINLLRNNAQGLRLFRGDTEDRFLCYLHVISCRVVINYYRRIRHTQITSFSDLCHSASTTASSPEDILTATTETEEEVELSLLNDFVLRELRKCYKSKNQERDIFIFELYYLAGKTAKEISSEYPVGLGQSGVDTVISRMKQKLKSSLEA